MKIKAMEFEYSGDITVISKNQFNVHQKLYNGYVSKANEICDLLKEETKKVGNTTYSEYRGIKKGQSFALDGVILHELYFKNLGGEGIEKGKLFLEGIDKNFGSYDNWVNDFKACAGSARGWAILVYEQRSGSLMNMLLDTHDEGIIMGSYPILVLDMYEHAYYIDYENNKDKYINKFMENINWDVVNTRCENVFGQHN